MPRSYRHMKDGALLHGSDHMFKEGDTVMPGKDNLAWASTNKEVAQSYGKNLYRVTPIDDATRHPGAAAEFGIFHSDKGYKVLGKED